MANQQPRRMPIRNSHTQETTENLHNCRSAPYQIPNTLPRKSPAAIALPPKTTITSKTRFLVISDTHDMDFGVLKPPKVDIVLHCGDMTENGGIAEYEKFIRSIGALEAELRLVIAGNHDVDLDRDFFVKEGGDVAKSEDAINLWKGELAQKMGVMYLEEGTHSFTSTSGATFTIYASPYTPKYGVSAFQYPSGEDRFNPADQTPSWATNVSTPNSIIPAYPAVDIVMTHGPPKYIRDDCSDRNSGGCEHLRRAICRAKPRLHCFGHIHHGWGAQQVSWDTTKTSNELNIYQNDDRDGDDAMVALPPEFIGKNSSKKKGYAALSPASSEALVHGDQTLFVNAAIMDDQHEPSNPPWVVELDLPVRRVKSEGEVAYPQEVVITQGERFGHRACKKRGWSVQR